MGHKPQRELTDGDDHWCDSYPLEALAPQQESQ